MQMQTLGTNTTISCRETPFLKMQALKHGLHVTFLHRFSLRSNMGWIYSFGAVYTWRKKLSKRPKVSPTKTAQKTVRASVA